MNIAAIFSHLRAAETFPLPFCTNWFHTASVSGSRSISFIMTSNCDFLRDQAPVLARRLIELEVPHLVRVYGTKAAPLYHVFHCNVRLADGMRCNDEECGWFRLFV